jgi:GT2 family glycosyltransferase
MQNPTVSVVIPVYSRTDNLCITFAHLAKQTYARDLYDIVIGAFRLPARDVDKLSKATVGMKTKIVEVAGESWNVSRARNTAIAEGTGDIILLLDADIAVLPTFLHQHVGCHSSDACAVAGAVESFTPYQKSADETDSENPGCGFHPKARKPELDARWEVIDKMRCGFRAEDNNMFSATAVSGRCIPLPWAFFWSGNVSISRCFLEAHCLMFDESFEGWGAEDMEWGFRAWKAGASMLFCRRANGMHLPHDKNVAENIISEQANLRRFIQKHPCLPVEVVTRYNDMDGNRRFNEISSGIQRVFHQTTEGIGCFMAIRNDRSERCAAVGIDADEARGYDPRDVYPILGIATWFCDCELDEVRVSKRLRRLPPWLLEEVLREAHRVGKSVAC